MAVISIDLGGTKLAGALCTKAGRLVAQDAVALEARQGCQVGELVRQQIHRLVEQAAARKLSVQAVGVSVPGISHTRNGTVWAPNIPGWERYPLRREIESVLKAHAAPKGRGRTVPIVIEGDRACYILGEAWRGAARGCRNAIFLAVGTGIGAGILADGQVLRGSHGIAGSIGWLALDRPFQPKYTGCGCFEYHASGEGLRKVAAELRAQKQPPANDNPAPLTAREVFAACQNGDPIAQAVLGQAIEFWGMAVANLVSLFNPEKILFGGGVFGPAVQFLEAIHAEARKWAQPVAINQVKLIPARLGGSAGLYGAAFLALEAGSA